ncbi:MAG TPA: sulfite exporter TauE/SafE family protein [Thermomicrobiales bacterium]|nr:sulfite exporter TauE/SafE family protein [Thermomicrobiales bacterium]
MHDVDLFVLALFAGSILAGLFGALAGLGGGVLLVPLLTLGFGVPIHLAIGASIVSVIATSSAAGAAYVADRLTNLRVAMVLEVATSLGAVTGALVAPRVPVQTLYLLFGLILLGSLVPTLAKLGETVPQGVVNDRFAQQLRLDGVYPSRALGRPVAYQVTRVPLGFGLMYVAGITSGLLGIGSGALKVLALDAAMRLPIKVSSATSNFMIGVTAAASAGIYFWRGDVVPLIAAPVALGVLLGATGGAWLLPRLHGRVVRWIFLVALAAVAVQMLLRGLGIA